MNIKLIYIGVAFFVFGCTNNQKEKSRAGSDNRVAIMADTLNTVKLSDTLVIYESTCRGCAYEGSTNFDISDSMGLIKLDRIITTDNSPADMDGGSISKDLLLIPVKTGLTRIKLYKFLTPEKKAEDSSLYTTYQIEVKQ